MFYKKTIIIFLLLIINQLSFSQNKKIKWVVGGEIALYTISYLAMNSLWYSGHEKSSFHLFDDSKEWLQMDKVGHSFTAYQLCRTQTHILNWADCKDKKHILISGLTSWLAISSVEILDGFSKKWGASLSDLAANTLGTGLFSAQQYFWGEQKFLFKYSYHNSKYSKYRPNILGENLGEKMFKDYNASTYWLSFNSSLISSNFPKWLCFSIGYGAEGMTGGHENPTIVNDKTIPYFKRYRQWYFSLDIDCTKIKTKSKFLKVCFDLINTIKIPMPTIEWSKNKVKFHPVYF